MREMEVGEDGGQTQKSHERSEEELVGGPARKRTKTDPPSTNDDSTDIESQIMEKISKLNAKGWSGIYITEWNQEKFGHYSQLTVTSHSKGNPIRMIGTPSKEESYSHEVDIQYLKLLREMVESENTDVLNPYFNYPLICKLASKSTFDLLDGSDIADCIQDYIYIYGYVESIEDWKRMYDYLLEADTDIKNEISNDARKFKKEMYQKFPAVNVAWPEISTIGRMWTVKQQNWEEIVHTTMGPSINSFEEEFRCRLKDIYTKSDYLKLKLELARKLGIITEEYDANFIPCHPPLPDVD